MYLYSKSGRSRSCTCCCRFRSSSFRLCFQSYVERQLLEFGCKVLDVYLRILVTMQISNRHETQNITKMTFDIAYLLLKATYLLMYVYIISILKKHLNNI